MVTTIGNFQGLNPETNKVINYMSGRRTVEQIVGEYFDLKKEVIYDDDGETVKDMINDFKDLKTLTRKKVQYNEKLKELGVTEIAFNQLFPQLPNPKDFIVKKETEKEKIKREKEIEEARELARIEIEKDLEIEKLTKELEILKTNLETNGKANGGEQSNTGNITKAKKK